MHPAKESPVRYTVPLDSLFACGTTTLEATRYSLPPLSLSCPPKTTPKAVVTHAREPGQAGAAVAALLPHRLRHCAPVRGTSK